jgi:putative mRNA 3-end processing factor
MVPKKPNHRDPFVMRTTKGLYCPRADAYIDPWKPVSRALITHAHADHARSGSAEYHCAKDGVGILKHRLGTEAITGHPYNKPFQLGEVEVSFHPAGHILGSAQIRLSDGDQTWVITGDYKRNPDPSCQPFEPVACDVLITEATFALPVYRWSPMDDIMAQLFRWWDANIQAKRTPILLCYSLGKAQRIMAEIGARSTRSVAVHSAIANLNTLYETEKVQLCPWARATELPKGVSTDLILAPPQVLGSTFLKRFEPVEIAMASGWMQIRGIRRRAAVAQGFVVSDHADWHGLLKTVRESGAQQVFATHGETRVLVRYLNEVEGLDAHRLETAFGIETGYDQ